MVMFKDMDEEHILWETTIEKFSKREIVEFYRLEKQKTKLLKEVIAMHKLIIKQGVQRLELSRTMEV